MAARVHKQVTAKPKGKHAICLPIRKNNRTQRNCGEKLFKLGHENQEEFVGQGSGEAVETIGTVGRFQVEGKVCQAMGPKEHVFFHCVS